MPTNSPSLRSFGNRDLARLPFASLALWLCVVFALGGSSRADVPYLQILRPASLMVSGLGLAMLRRDAVLANRGVLAFAACCLALAVIHLVPLPPGIWHRLPGREIIAEIDAAAGLGPVWRPLSMSPELTRNALWSLFVPLSVLMLAIQLSTEELMRIAGLVLGLGAVSALMALAQLLGDPAGPLYIYPVTNNGAAVGLFANRNHQAVFLACLIPLALALLRARSKRTRSRRDSVRRDILPRLATLSFILFLVPLVLVTGSRAGLACLVISLALSLTLLKPRRKGDVGRAQLPANWRRAVNAAAALAIVGVALLTVFYGRALAIDRLIAADPMDDMRARILPTVMAMLRLYAPFGCGIGTFEKVYLIHEPDALLSATYANHVHDDWLELALTGGVPALALLAWAMIAWLRGCTACWRSRESTSPSRDLAIAALVCLGLLALGSIGDYPLRVPALMALATLCAVWSSRLPTPGTEVDLATAVNGGRQ